MLSGKELFLSIGSTLIQQTLRPVFFFFSLPGDRFSPGGMKAWPNETSGEHSVLWTSPGEVQALIAKFVYCNRTAVLLCNLQPTFLL